MCSCYVFYYSPLQKQPPEVYYKKGVLKNFAKFRRKHLCLTPVTLLKKRPWHRCFPLNFAKFLRAPFLQNTSGRLLLPLEEGTTQASMQHFDRADFTDWMSFLPSKLTEEISPNPELLSPNT